MKKRVFIGIKINAVLAADIVIWQKKHDKNLRVRWTSKNNLHLTLLPPWYEEDIGCLKENLNKLHLSFPTFEILFKDILFGPNNKRPRLVWAEGPVPNQLLFLKRNVEERLGVAPEKKEFRFHITLGRFKEKNFQKLKNNIQTGSVSWKMKVNSFHLFESKLSPKGADYKVLKEIKLR